MRPLDELARLWNDTRSRLPQGAWSWPLVAAAGGALLVLAGTSSSDVPAKPRPTLAVTPVAAPAPVRIRPGRT